MSISNPTPQAAGAQSQDAQHDATPDLKRQRLDEDEEDKTGIKPKTKSSQTYTQLTLRKPRHTYLQLVLHVMSSTAGTQTTQTERNMDILTLRQNMNSALTQFLGLMGSAIQLDILGLTASSSRDEDGQSSQASLPISQSAASHGISASIARKTNPIEACVRVSRLDADAVQEAMSAWVGRASKSDGGEERWKWVVKGRDDWLFRLGSDDGQSLFGD